MDCRSCKNYEAYSLSRVTRKEVALKLLELSDDDCQGGCYETKEYFGIDHIRIECTGLNCGDCISIFTKTVNKERGFYE